MDFFQHNKEHSGGDGTDLAICCPQLEAFLLQSLFSQEPHTQKNMHLGERKAGCPCQGVPWNSKVFTTSQWRKKKKGLSFKIISALFVSDDVNDVCVRSNSQCVCISKQTLQCTLHREANWLLQTITPLSKVNSHTKKSKLSHCNNKQADFPYPIVFKNYVYLVRAYADGHTHTLYIYSIYLLFWCLKYTKLVLRFS